jgi:hypothetical protein
MAQTAVTRDQYAEPPAAQPRSPGVVRVQGNAPVPIKPRGVGRTPTSSTTWRPFNIGLSNG